jgi:hypothetical protein
VTLRGTKSDIFMVAADAPVPAAHSRQDGLAAPRSRRQRACLSCFKAGDTSAARRRDRCRGLTGRQIAFRDAVPRRWCMTVSVARDELRQRQRNYSV